jgi:hypothetical protein
MSPLILSSHQEVESGQRCLGALMAASVTSYCEFADAGPRDRLSCFYISVSYAYNKNGELQTRADATRDRLRINSKPSTALVKSSTIAPPIRSIAVTARHSHVSRSKQIIFAACCECDRECGAMEKQLFVLEIPSWRRSGVTQVRKSLAERPTKASPSAKAVCLLARGGNRARNCKRANAVGLRQEEG